MRINLVSDDKKVGVQYIQSLVLLFMPCEKFSQSDEGGTVLDFFIEVTDGCFVGKAVLVYEETKTEKFLCERVSDYDGSGNSAKCFAGKLFLSLFSERFSYKPPWGIMTGVRPARFALEFLRCGKTKEETKNLLQKYYFADADKAELAILVALFDMDVLDSAQIREYSLYIGIPFCPSRCRYCSFVSYATPKLRSLLPEYISALSDEVDILCQTANEADLKLKSIYIGGGTPSVLDASQMKTFLERVRNAVGDGDFEFTYEAGRPDTVTEEKLSVLRDFGVTRLSINTQTTNDEILRSVGRNHTFNDYKKAYFAAKEKGFFVNTDLIAGLPGEAVESFQKSIDDVCALSPDNITVHSFSLKKSSEYTVSGQKLCSDDRHMERMLSYSSSKLSFNGYFPYYMYRQKNTDGNFENVGYTKEKEGVALYNVYMMEGFHSVLAAGAGASTKLVSKDLSTIGKLYNPKYPYEYLRDINDILKNKEQILSFYKEKYR